MSINVDSPRLQQHNNNSNEPNEMHRILATSANKNYIKAFRIYNEFT